MMTDKRPTYLEAIDILHDLIQSTDETTLTGSAHTWIAHRDEVPAPHDVTFWTDDDRVLHATVTLDESEAADVIAALEAEGFMRE